MGPLIFSFESYVEIAVSMANQDSDHESLKQLIRNIRKWQECHPDSGKPVEETPLSDLQFSALFLQHPFTAISLWNVMQRFYALDRLVCATSKESLEKIREWEEMPLFKYLEAGKVEKRWRNSLQELGRGIKESSKQEEASLSPKVNVLSSFSETRNGLTGIPKAYKEGIKSETLLRRIDGIHSSITKLDTSLRELRRNLKENLESVDLREGMLKQIEHAARIRYSMIDTYLKMDENMEAGDVIDQESDGSQFSGKLALYFRLLFLRKPLRDLLS